MSSLLIKYTEFCLWRAWAYRTVICVSAGNQLAGGSSDVTALFAFDTQKCGMTRSQLICFNNVRVSAKWDTFLAERLTLCGEEFLVILHIVTVWPTGGLTLTKRSWSRITKFPFDCRSIVTHLLRPVILPGRQNARENNDINFQLCAL
jgi:hypothetical protein